jgi:hypothetical protein
MKRKINRRRFLIAYDGCAFFLRAINYVIEDQESGRLIYHCNRHLAGPFSSITQALKHAKRKGYATAVPKRSVHP